MSELICDTTVLQYLHQIGQSHLLPRLASSVIVPKAVVDELAAGIAHSIDLPAVHAWNWARIIAPVTQTPIPDAGDLGPGELQVLWLAMERPGSIAVLDDRRAREVAMIMQLPITGTLGLLLDAKRALLISAVGPLIDALRRCGFHVSARAAEAVLRAAGETA